MSTENKVTWNDGESYTNKDGLRSVCVFKGSDGSLMIQFKTGEKETHSRITPWAAQALLSLLARAINRPVSNDDKPDA